MRISKPLETLLFSVLSAVAGAAPTIQNYAEADLVIGQTDYVSNLSSNSPTASSLKKPSSVVVDPVSRKVFVSDSGNHRILRFSSADALADGIAAEAVFGQQVYTTGTYRPTSNKTIAYPKGIFLDYKGRLWVTDFDNRILMFNEASSRSSGEAADRVFGQPDFNRSSFGPINVTRSNFGGPVDLCVDVDDHLWVADTGNNRVLRFDAITSKPNGAMPDGVLGQVNFTTGRNGADVSPSTIGYPTGVSVSGNGTLYVTCSDENRILRFDRAATLIDGAVANAVFGQPDFTTSSSGTNSAKFSGVNGNHITADDSLWVNDSGSNRLLRFSGASTLQNGAVANGLLGQPNFTQSPSKTTRRDFDSPEGKPFVDTKGSVWIADTNNNRVLRFSPDLIKPRLRVVTQIPKITKLPFFVLKGTAIDASGIKSVQYRLGKGTLTKAKGKKSWSLKIPLNKGVNLVTLITTDNVGNVSYPRKIKLIRR